MIFVNNRGEDTVITVKVDKTGKLTRTSAFTLGRAVESKNPMYVCFVEIPS